MKRSNTVWRMFYLAAMLLTIVSFAGTAAAGSVSSSLGLAPYPAKGQSAEQQGKDEGECYSWSKQQTGIDPAAVANAPAPKSGPSGERVRGAARGAAAGAVIGEVADDDSEKGAKTGAAVGVVAGGKKSRDKKAAQQEQAEQAKASSMEQFNKGFKGCMEGRGYTIK